MADTDWQTYTFESHYPESDGGTRADMVVAPDRDTARRLAAVQTLDDLGSTLREQGYDTLLHFYGGAMGGMSILAEWGDLKGTACPNCTAHCGKDTGVEMENGGTIHECDACGYQWLPIGFGSKRQQLIENTKAAIKGLDRFERISAINLDKLGLGEMNLDTAVDLFRDEPNAETAAILRDQADQYHDDGMIESGTWSAYFDETAPYLTKETEA